ncbi:putative maleylacetoacetate isomerase 1 [Anticarsia gemmatalis]|uniref:putative maleylacetoacetate isomerase 1 n=1 Tax=Anticarsia gemmatalis TaxID=129554 RepID=UPI003F75AF6C
MVVEKGAVLYAYWMSSCSWRVRAALTLKKIPFEERSVDIVKARNQLTEEYRSINPAQKVPALCIDDAVLVESMAIIQYLEETRPAPSLTPNTPLLRARMREICETVVAGIQPLQNVGLKSHFETEDQFQKFTRYWSERGLKTLDDLLRKSAGKYCVGDQITIADICLVPQVFNAISRYSLDVTKFPTVSKLYETLLTERVFQETHPKSVRAKK